MNPDAPTWPSIGIERFTDEFLEGLRAEGDVKGDQAVTTFFEAIDKPGSSLYTMIARTTGAALEDEQAPGVGPFVKAIEPWPAWADRELVRRGQDLFGDWGMQLASGLFLSSLPLTYACAKGAEPLVRTARMTSYPKRRILETGQMIIDAMSPGALEPGARGYSTVRHVRLMHAAVRHTLTDPVVLRSAGGPAIEPWDPTLGVPLNQEDLLGCLLAFSAIGVDSLAKVGVKLSEDQRECYVHTWNLVGHQIGIREDLLPLDYHDASVVTERILARQTAASVAGMELTATAIEAMQDILKARALRGLPASGMRFFLGDQTADLLGVPPSNWSRTIFTLMGRVDRVTNRALSWLPGNHSLSAALGRRVVKGIEDAERGVGRPKFQITDELRAAWGIG